MRVPVGRRSRWDQGDPFDCNASERFADYLGFGFGDLALGEVQLVPGGHLDTGQGQDFATGLVEVSGQTGQQGHVRRHVGGNVAGAIL
ncbi:hypothetical protein ACFCXF_14595 [Streptomyces virginiae]|uniref:hypothetical protein n=1 Tax=Streptomyces virginiae TaxID=1961 RepID=UPI0035DB22B5